ncbi:thioredoxin domain-containing protein [uncultured Bacteroides sp.]|uniref:thioredoxin family protein n=2 Tax=uncultured Bacteroides sp. TaxID=162156 RepID=UPI0023BEA6E1|nr:thioredoxin domain-containing protein [uncultured Bacteroides sp.]MDE5702767.1 redoxin domain-containing protein [Bacteroides sp.]MDE6171759.1 redoxin domain-containing protein [Bacteroides sp.]
MRKTMTLAVLLFASVLTFACKDGTKAQPNEVEQKNTQAGEVIVMDKEMFIKNIFDYEKSQQWKYKGDKPAIIDLYADWCGPCRMVAPIMKELAKEYADKITIYKVNVDKERELAALFNASSIPLFVFIPMEEEPQLFRGAADKATYKKAIDEFLLKKEVTSE